MSDAFERSYDARDRKVGRPEDRGAVLAVWQGLVQHASARDSGLVGVLPPVDIEEHLEVYVHCECDWPVPLVEACERMCTRL